MVDRTYLKCHVYDCPDGQRTAARAALEEWGPWGEYEDDPESPVDGWTVAMDVPCDTVPGIAAALRAAAPGASWVTWEEPTGTRPGRVAAFTPALGQYDGQCDASGETLVGLSDFSALREEHTGKALISAIDAALGGPWARHLARAQRRPAPPAVGRSPAAAATRALTAGPAPRTRRDALELE